MAVRSAFWGLSKPRRCRFLVKNSEMEISRCRAAIDVASSRLTAVGRAGDFDFDSGSGFGLDLDLDFGAAATASAGVPASKRPSWAERADTGDFLGMRAFIVATRGRAGADSADDADAGRTTKARSCAARSPASSLRRKRPRKGARLPAA